MRVLLDTHTFLWWITNDPLLSERAREVISRSGNELFISAASGWEIAIKYQIGKLPLPDVPSRFVAEQLALNGFVSIPVEMRHGLHVHTLPLLHRDPFDRLLVAQSQLEALPLLTIDPQIAQYDVKTIW